MELSEAKEIVAEIHNKKILEEEKINSFVKSTGKISSNLDWIKILSFMIDDKFSYIFYIGKKIIECAISDSEYVDLIVKMSHNDKFLFDLSKLIELYDKNSVIAEFVYKKLFDVIDEKNAIAIGYIIGGMGRANPKKLFKIIDTSTNSDPNKIAFLFGLQITSENQKLPKRLVEFIISCNKSTNHTVQQIVINTLILRFSNVKRVQNILKKMIQINDFYKTLIARAAIGLSRTNEKFAMELLIRCSKTDTANVADAVSLSIGKLASKFPLECITMVKRWTKNQKFTHRSYDWFIEEIGKGDIQKIESFMLKWINSEKNYIVSAFHLPDIVCSVYRYLEDDLIKLMNKLDHKKPRISTLILKILEKYLSEGFRKAYRKDSFMSECNKLLMRISFHQSLDVQLDASIKNPVIQTLALIHAIEVKEKIPDIQLAIKNLDKFSNIVSFFGKRTLMDLITQKPKHPLVWYFANARITKAQINKKLRKLEKAKHDWQKPYILRSARELAYSFSMLSDLDVSLTMIGKKEQGRSRIKDGLLDEQDFYQTLIELNIVSRLKKKYHVVMQPKFGNNLLDARVNVGNQVCLFEIYSPKEDIRLEHIRIVHGMDNKAKKSILAKVNSQIKSTAGTNLPVIVVIDRTVARSINEESIVDLLHGTLGFTWVLNKETGETVSTYASRADDSLSAISAHGNLVSAVILLTREFDGNDFRIKLYGKIYRNPNTSIQIPDPVIKKIEKTLFGKGVF